jgi:hypothetical protein
MPILTIAAVNAAAGRLVGEGIQRARGKGVSYKTRRKIRRAKRRDVRAIRKETRKTLWSSEFKEEYKRLGPGTKKAEDFKRKIRKDARKKIRAVRKQKRKDIIKGQDYYEKRLEKEATAERGRQFQEKYGTDPMSRQSQQMYGTRSNINRQGYPTQYNQGNYRQNTYNQGRYGSGELSSPKGNGVYYSSSTNSSLYIDPYSQQLLQL